MPASMSVKQASPGAYMGHLVWESDEAMTWKYSIVCDTVMAFKFRYSREQRWGRVGNEGK